MKQIIENLLLGKEKFLEEFISKSQEHLYIDGIVSCPYTEGNVIKDILILVPKNELINTI